MYIWCAVYIYWCGVQIFWCAGKNSEHSVQNFAASLLHFVKVFAALWQEFCHFMVQVLPAYGASFAD